jgi:type IV pilus assembly protein PilN
MRLDINLASAPYEDLRSFWLRWGGLLAGLGVITLVLVYSAIAGWASAAKDRSLIRQCETQIAARDKQRQDALAMLNRPDNISVRDRSQFLNDLFERKAFSWTKVFEELERVMPPHLHLVSIAPEMSLEHQLELKLVVAGESRDRAIELVRNMEDSRHFQQTQIVQENVAVQQTAGDNVQVDISALYVPESVGAGATETAAKRSPR